MFDKAELAPKNEDLNNFYQDSLENAREKIQSQVTEKVIDLITKKQLKTPLDAERDRQLGQLKEIEMKELK